VKDAFPYKPKALKKQLGKEAINITRRHFPLTVTANPKAAQAVRGWKIFFDLYPVTAGEVGFPGRKGRGSSSLKAFVYQPSPSLILLRKLSFVFRYSLLYPIPSDRSPQRRKLTGRLKNRDFSVPSLRPLFLKRGRSTKGEFKKTKI
jgi:hypothetical protein